MSKEKRREYYQKNKKKICEKRKYKYRNDLEYRKTLSMKAKLKYIDWKEKKVETKKEIRARKTKVVDVLPPKISPGEK